MSLKQEINSIKTPRLIPVNEWSKYHPWPPTGGLRHLIFHAKTNGFDICIARAGRRVLIDEAKFFEWIDNQKEKKTHETK